MAASVEEKDQMVPNVNEVAREFEQGTDDVDFPTLKIRGQQNAPPLAVLRCSFAEK